MAKELSAKQQRFVDEYLIDFNISKAALRAGYSEKTGARLLKNEAVEQLIRKRRNDLQDKTAITAQRVVQELAGIGFDRDHAKNMDRIRALELIGKHIGMFDERITANVTATTSVTATIDVEKSKLDCILQQLKGGSEDG